MAARRPFLRPATIASMLEEEDDDDLVEPEPSDESEEEDIIETRELIFNGQGQFLQEKVIRNIFSFDCNFLNSCRYR